MSEPLTPLEERVYHFLLDFLSENTFQPSVREIGKRFRIRSTKTVAEILQSIADKGFIERDITRSRGVRILGFSGAGRVQPVPVYERLSPDTPPFSREHCTRFVAVDRAFLPGTEALFVRADQSLKGRGILSGDLLLIDPTARAHEGDVVAVRREQEILVRVLSRRGSALVLLGTEPPHEEIALGPGDDFSIVGVAAGVFRPFTDRQEPVDD